MLNKIRKSEMK